MAHVAAWKKDRVKELVTAMTENPVVAIVDVHGIPGQQIQSMRAGLRAHATIRMAKNNLILLAIDEAAKKKPGLEGLKEFFGGQCAMGATDINPFRLFRQLEATKTPAPAKAGDKAPHDIVVPKGPTPFGPGPIIGELQKIGIPAAIEAGKIVVRKDATLVKSGDPIPAPVAAMLPKLGILPMIVGLDIRSAFESGTVYRRNVLDIPEGYYLSMFATAAFNARALGVAIAFPTKETIVPLMAKAYREALSLSISAAIPTRENIEMLLAKADSQMLALAAATGSTDERVTARLKAASAKPAPAKADKAPAAKKEEKIEEKDEKVTEEEAAAGLSALFG
ncbi:MAG: 50S ribosomal protein L10 [Methanomassiliicoccaceae archaeon]|jgi:large subunit ribosomal protein L10|nr:50S ribosomal protein L10 [Methanomassiliicoccaceae archaeon]